jgi:hypothetical protein
MDQIEKIAEAVRVEPTPQKSTVTLLHKLKTMLESALHRKGKTEPHVQEVIDTIDEHMAELAAAVSHVPPPLDPSQTAALNLANETTLNRPLVKS